MEHAVSLVQSYLYVNGFLTVTEHPVLEVLGEGTTRMATDVDIVAYRVPRAGGLSTTRRAIYEERGHRSSDPALGLSDERAEMLIVEVKHGKAELNARARSPEVLRAVLHRFGCCDGEALDRAVADLRKAGEVVVEDRLRTRLVAFGSITPSGGGRPYLSLSLGRVVEFLDDHLSRNWSVLRTAQVKDPAFGLLLTIEKARRAMRSTGG